MTASIAQMDLHPGLRRQLAARVESTINNLDIAEKLHAAALFNHAQMLEAAEPNEVKWLTWPELTEVQQHMYRTLARAHAMVKVAGRA